MQEIKAHLKFDELQSIIFRGTHIRLYIQVIMKNKWNDL